VVAKLKETLRNVKFATLCWSVALHKLVAPKDFYLDQNTIPLTLLSHLLYHRPGFKRQLMFQDVTAKYCIYDKVPSLLMSFFVRIKGCVNCRTTTSVYKKRVLTRWIVYSLGAFSENDRIAFKFNSSLLLLSLYRWICDFPSIDTFSTVPEDSTYFS
jgi:hypothetical protein